MAGHMEAIRTDSDRHASPDSTGADDTGPDGNGAGQDQVEPTGPAWRGRFEAFSVGDPGRAPSRVVTIPEPGFWHRPDTVVDGVTISDQDGRLAIHLRAASIRGLMHRCYGRVRQDQYAFRAARDGRFTVLCVADGVSSGRLSHLAAVWAAEQGVGMLAEQLAETEPDAIDGERFLVDVAELIGRRGWEYLRRHGHDVEQSRSRVADLMATTALYGVVDLGTAGDDHPVHLIGVGDTSAWLLRDGTWHPQQAVKNADEEIYSSSTFALPLLPKVFPPVIRTEVRAGDALVLMTDGVGDPLGDGTGEVGAFLADRWRQPPGDIEFAAQVGFTRRTYDDDRTAIAVWPIARP